MPLRDLSRASLALALSTGPALMAQGFHLDYRPTARLVELDTDSTLIQPTVGPPVRVVGGVFLFRSVVIPAGVEVRGVGSRPLIWIVTQDFRIEGRLAVDGGPGADVNVLASANFPTPGGRAGAGGGAGGFGSPLSFDRSPFGQPGFGPAGIPALGGGGGLLSCTLACGRGSGGGGGSFATVGDVDHLLGAAAWLQVGGAGGPGCLNRTLPGGSAGASPFVDGRDDNDFWGLGIDVFQRRFVPGELPVPIGGSGGGGGGDKSARCTTNDPSFVLDDMGGGGGGGGGAVVVLALGRITVGPTGYVSANGGGGGGGAQAGSNNQAGGGGGGSGGMIVLASATGVDLHVKGETYVNAPDGDFVLSADGGVGMQSAFAGTTVRKYPPGTPSMGSLPSGGFGGLGVIQLMAPLGTNADGTNTILDDHITLYSAGQPLTGSTKVRYLGWRGFRNASGVRVDDFGNPITLGRGNGDMRPDPMLVPIF
ncbi:MAG: hypothetical protein IPM29_23450 [Planctomycetes bacterium]|nr:hypothetical protein [Planctomycetota bacterium]